MRKEIMLAAAIVLTFFVASAICLADGASADPSESNADEITVTVNGEIKNIVKTDGTDSYLFDTASTNSDSGIISTGKGDTFQNYEIFTGSDYVGASLEIHIPEGKALYLMKGSKINHYAVDFSDGLSSIKITGTGELKVLKEMSSETVHQRYIGFNGVPTTIDGITLQDEVLIFGGSIATESKLDSTDLRIISLTYENSADNSAQIVAGSRFGDVGTTNLVIDNVDSNGVKVRVFGGSYNTFQLLTVCGNVSESNVTINGGVYTEVYGGNYLMNTDPNDLEVPSSSRCESTNVTINGGTVDIVYGGGYDNDDGKFTISTGDTCITVAGTADITNIFGGGHYSETDSTHLIMTGGNVSSNIFGGSRFAGETGDVRIDVSGGSFKSSIYGGNFAQESNSDHCNDITITMTGGSVAGNVYGGGSHSGCGDVIINIVGDVEFSKDSRIYGGSNDSGDVGDIKITVKDVKYVHSIYGGSLGSKTELGGHSDSASITVDNSNVRETYGGGRYATTDVSETVYLAGSTVENHVFGGGYGAPVKSTHIVINDGVSVAHSVYGGGHYDSTESVTIDILGGDIGRGVLAGGRDDNSLNSGNTGSSSVGNAVINVYGGNIGQTGDKDRGVFAGGGSDDENGQITGSVSINIHGGNVYAVTLSDANVTNPTTPPQTPEVEISGGTFNTSIKNEWLADGLSVSYDSEGNVIIGESRPPIIWDDDDEYIPPIVPAQPEDSGNDTTTIVACAAAAVVAALMAAFLILDRRH